MVSIFPHSGANTPHGRAASVPGTFDPAMESLHFQFPRDQENSLESKPWVETPVAYLLLQMAVKACFQRTLVEMNERGLIPDKLIKYADNAANRLAKADATRLDSSSPAHSILEGYSFQDLPAHLLSKLGGEYFIYILSEVHAHSLCKVGIAERNSTRPFNQYWSALGLVESKDLLRSIFSEYLIGTAETIHEAVSYDRRSQEREHRIRRADARGSCAAGDPDITRSARRALELGNRVEVCLQDATALWPLVANYIKQYYPVSNQPWQQSFASFFPESEVNTALQFRRVVMLGASDRQKFDRANCVEISEITADQWGALSSWGHRAVFYAAMFLAPSENEKFRFIDTEPGDWIKLQVNLSNNIERIREHKLADILGRFSNNGKPERVLGSLFGFTDCESELRAIVELVRQYSGSVFSQGEQREDLVPELLLYSVLPFIENKRTFSNARELRSAIEDRFLGKGTLSADSGTFLDNPSGFLSFLCCLSAFEIEQELTRTGLPHFFVFPFVESSSVAPLFDIAGPIARGNQIYISSDHFSQIAARLENCLDESDLERLIQIDTHTHERLSAEEFLRKYGGGAGNGYTFLGNLSMELDTFYEFQVVVDGPKGFEVCVLAVPKDRCSCIKTKLEHGSEERVRWVVSLTDEIAFE